MFVETLTAAIIIQACWRGYIVRSTTERQIEEHFASTIIQNWWRAKKLRLVYVEMRKQILKIQAHCRGHLARIVYRELKQRERLKQRHAEIVIERRTASIKIQSYWRMYFARKGLIQNFLKKSLIFLKKTGFSRKNTEISLLAHFD